jgi:hypothetical protein
MFKGGESKIHQCGKTLRILFGIKELGCSILYCNNNRRIYYEKEEINCVFSGHIGDSTNGVCGWKARRECPRKTARRRVPVG